MCDEENHGELIGGIINNALTAKEKIRNLSFGLIKHCLAERVLNIEVIKTKLDNLLEIELDKLDIKDVSNSCMMGDTVESRELKILEYTSQIASARNGIASANAKQKRLEACDKESTTSSSLDTLKEKIENMKTSLEELQQLKVTTQGERAAIVVTLKTRQGNRLKLAKEVRAAIISFIIETGM